MCRINAVIKIENNSKAIEEWENYSQVLTLSLLFYEAQRSGKLPKDNRILWRGDSALNDRGSNGEDLTGGYYDAGDFVKFGFTMASTTTLLAWGAVSWPRAYKAADQLDEIHKTIKWATDYFIKCHVSKNVLYGQMGNFNLDHRFWGRPEEMPNNTNARPAYKIDPEHPGSDLAGETAAALAASSIVFKWVDPEYSAKCLKHAKELYKFANASRGLYHESIQNAKQFYESTGYGDELAWAAVWLYKTTKFVEYLDDAVNHYQHFCLNERPNKFYYNNKIAGVQVLLAQLTGDRKYREAARVFCDFAVKRQKRTPEGLLYISKFGTLRHAANVAFVCLEAADIPEIGNSSQYYQFAKEQINYMLERSYVVGYGSNSPKQPHHAASSCPNRPAPCGWAEFDRDEPNPQILYGALVSGPDEKDAFKDIREEDIYTEVMIDYNAGFTSALVGLLQKQLGVINEG